jgi:hypothetical protein
LIGDPELDPDCLDDEDDEDDLCVDDLGSYCSETEDAQFSNNGGRSRIEAIIGDAKPYRNVIKRYWTEEEVRFAPIHQSFL